MSQPIITPSKFLRRDALPSEAEDCSLALVGFCRFYDMVGKLSAKPLSESICSHLDRSHQFVGQAGGAKVLALECLYGGPLSATVIEELAHYGIQKVIGYGYAGSLIPAISVGEIFLADEAFVSDGTSREYLPDVSLAHPDRALADSFRERATRSSVPVHGVKVWTTDAIYREYPEKVAAWRQAGAQVVDMDTSHFYAVSQVVGVSAMYAGVVSDRVEGPAWEDGFDRIRQAVSALQDAILEMLAYIGDKERDDG